MMQSNIMNHYIEALFLIMICQSYVTSLHQPEVTIEQGVVRGLYSKTFGNREMATFEGIPFAKPPLGKHRFKEPVPADPWIGIYNATREPPQCLQLDMLITNSILGSEDCLFINVYTPKLPDEKKTPNLDVIAFIHGGAFYLGKSGFHGPGLLLERDIVLVTFNYRLGPLGFLSTGDQVVPGNNAFKDQVLALKWIKKNIAAFGGNPNSVTLGGMSAGGVSCHYHTLSPLSKGLFKGAMCMGGVALNPWALIEDNKEKGMTIANDLGCPTNDSHLMIECLRTRPAEHIVASSKMFVYWGKTFPLVLFGPVVEPPSLTAFIYDSPENMLKSKRGSDVPILMGFARDEGLCGGAEILSTPGMINDLLNRWDELIPYLLDYNGTDENKLNISKSVKEFYKIDDSPDGTRNLVKMIGDRMFVAGFSKVAKISASSPTYLYRFSYRGQHSMTEVVFKNKNDIGVSHGDDAFYTVGFNNLKLVENEPDSLVSKKMLDTWVSFAANGSLTGEWSPVNKKAPKIIFTDIIGPNEFHLTVVDELGEEHFWESLGLDENIKPVLK